MTSDILFDDRESRSGIPNILLARGLPVVVARSHIDCTWGSKYGTIGLERKTAQDFLASLGTEKYKGVKVAKVVRQLDELGTDVRVLVIQGPIFPSAEGKAMILRAHVPFVSQRSAASVWNFLHRLSLRGILVYTVDDAEETAKLIETLYRLSTRTSRMWPEALEFHRNFQFK